MVEHYFALFFHQQFMHVLEIVVLFTRYVLECFRYFLKQIGFNF